MVVAIASKANKFNKKKIYVWSSGGPNHYPLLSHLYAFFIRRFLLVQSKLKVLKLVYAEICHMPNA
jgi:hypothetical protein